MKYLLIALTIFFIGCSNDDNALPDSGALTFEVIDINDVNKSYKVTHFKIMGDGSFACCETRTSIQDYSRTYNIFRNNNYSLSVQDNFNETYKLNVYFNGGLLIPLLELTKL